MCAFQFEALDRRRLFAAGAIDITFGNHGSVAGSARFESDAGFHHPVIHGSVQQSDGKLIVAGQVSTGDTTQSMLVARFNKDGTLDESYAAGGFITISFGGDHASANAIALDAQGRAIVAGYSSAGDKTSFALARLDSHGNLDRSFDSDGKLLTSFDQRTAVANDLEIAADGRIVAAGYSSTGKNGARFAAARYLSDGRLDTGFSVDGRQTIDIDSANDEARSVKILPDNRILLGGYLTRPDVGSDLAVVRLTSAGQLDKSFDGNGIAVADFGGNEIGDALLIQPSGSCLIGGGQMLAPNEFGAVYEDLTLAQFTATGELDHSFAKDGKLDSAELLPANTYHVTFAPDSPLRLLGAGNDEFTVITFNYDELDQTRITANGTLDMAFGDAGTLAGFLDEGIQSLGGIAPQSDGSLIAVIDQQSDVNGNDTDVFLLRKVLPTGEIDQKFGQQNRAAIAFPLAISDASVDVDGKLVVAAYSEVGHLFWRYTSGGKLDSTFGHGKRVRFDDEVYLDPPQLLTDGAGRTIAWGGLTEEDDKDPVAMTVLRLNKDGSFDTSYPYFTEDYTFIPDETDFAGPARLLSSGDVVLPYVQDFNDSGYVVLVRPNGKFVHVYMPALAPQDEIYYESDSNLVPVGTSGDVVLQGSLILQDDAGNQSTINALVRYRADGSLNKTLGGKGYVRGNYDLLWAQPDGKILYRSAGGIKRLTAAGGRDTTFGTAGVAASGYDHFTFDLQNRIVAWKLTNTGSVQIARFTKDGKPDKSFSGDGQTTVRPPVRGDVNLIVTSKDDLVITSIKRDKSSANWSVVRILGR